MGSIVRRFSGVLMALIMTVGLIGAMTVQPAQATSHASKSYQAPKKGQRSSAVKALQLRLVKAKSLPSQNVTGYFGSLTEKGVRNFQRKAKLKPTGKVDQKTWAALVAKTGTMKAPAAKKPAAKHKKVKGIDHRCLIKGRALCISKHTGKLYYMENGKVVRTLDARFGCSSTRTRQGTFKVYWKSRHHVSSIYHSKMPYAMFFSGGQAVHYSADFAARGYNGCSHGCVNIRSRSGIRWVFDQVRTGDRVVVYR